MTVEIAIPGPSERQKCAKTSQTCVYNTGLDTAAAMTQMWFRKPCEAFKEGRNFVDQLS